MPIMDGYEAAEMIIKHHQKSGIVLAPQNKLNNKSRKDQNQLDSLIKNKSIQGKNENNLQRELLNLMDEDVPILIALSALVNEQVRQKCMKSGFDLVIEAPLS